MVSNIEHVAVAQIRALYNTDKVVAGVLDWAARRDRDARETNVDLLMNQLGASKPQLIEVFKKLQDAGCGKLLYGRRGYKTRIRWACSLRSLGKAAKDGASQLDEINDELDDDAALEMQAQGREDTVRGGASVGIEHRFALRPDMAVTVSLPKDLTRREAERFATFIQSLPFES